MPVRGIEKENKMGSCEVKVPHSLDAILNIADDRSLIGKRLEDLIHDLHAGVSLKGIKEVKSLYDHLLSLLILII